VICYNINTLTYFHNFHNTTNTFKSRLDKFWHNRDITYNFKAPLHGTESRSTEVMYEGILVSYY